MNRNIDIKNDLQGLFKLIRNIKTDVEMDSFFKELLTEAEIETLSKRWRILNLLGKGCTQREVASELQVSLCKVTRGAKILKDEKSVLAKMIKEKNDDNN